MYYIVYLERQVLPHWHSHQPAEQDSSVRGLRVGKWKTQVQAALQDAAVQLLQWDRGAPLPGGARRDRLQQTSCVNHPSSLVLYGPICSHMVPMSAESASHVWTQDPLRVAVISGCVW